MYYTGFADEAGASIEAQIQATKELGWSNLEARSVDGTNLTDISEAQFEQVCEKLAAAEVHVNCFGSAVANWCRDPRSDEDLQYSVQALRRAIPRMHRLGARMIRGMSFAVVQDPAPDDPDLERIIFGKVGDLVRMCEEAGILYLHENCMNYGGLSHVHTLRLLEKVQSPNLKLVFDTGNPVFTDRRIGPKPYPKQSSWEFYVNVREWVHYVHIKDGRYLRETEGIFPEVEYTFPGDGDGDVERIVRDLLQTGYDGGFSIEPHRAVVFHNRTVQSEAQVQYDNYVEYGGGSCSWWVTSRETSPDQSKRDADHRTRARRDDTRAHEQRQPASKSESRSRSPLRLSYRLGNRFAAGRGWQHRSLPQIPPGCRAGESRGPFQARSNGHPAPQRPPTDPEGGGPQSLAAPPRCACVLACGAGRQRSRQGRPPAIRSSARFSSLNSHPRQARLSIKAISWSTTALPKSKAMSASIRPPMASKSTPPSIATMAESPVSYPACASFTLELVRPTKAAEGTP